MAVAELLNRLKARGEDAEATFDQLALDVVDGVDVSEEAIERACSLTGRSVKAFAARVHILNRRKQAYEKHHARDWEGEQKEARERYRTATSAREATAEERTALTTRISQLNEEARAAQHQEKCLDIDLKKSKSELSELLATTGDPHDWRITSL